MDVAHRPHRNAAAPSHAAHQPGGGPNAGSTAPAPSWTVSTLGSAPDGRVWDIGGSNPFTGGSDFLSASTTQLAQPTTLDRLIEQLRAAYGQGTAGTGGGRVVDQRLNSYRRVRLADGSVGALFDTQTTYSTGTNQRSLQLITVKGRTEAGAGFETALADFARMTTAVEPYLLTLRIH